MQLDYKQLLWRAHYIQIISVSGVLQGSVLGPYLSLVYINNLPESPTSLTKLFTDNTAVYRATLSNLDQVQLQQDILHLAEREKSWNMTFHPAKCTSCLSQKTNITNHKLQSQTLSTGGGGGGGFFLACEDLGRVFDNSFPACIFFFFKWRLACAH